MAKKQPAVHAVAAGVVASGGALAAGKLVRGRVAERAQRRRTRFRLRPDEGPADGIRRIARGQLELASDRLEHSGRNEIGEAIHEARKSLKRLRAVVRLTREKGADLLADAFLAARERDARLHLCLAGGGPEEEALRTRLGEHASFLGWLEGDGLARAYASADLFLFASRTDTFGQVLLEAQASGLPVVAVAEGGPCAIVEDGVTGLLRPAETEALADAVLELAGTPPQRERLAQHALEAVRERTWERSLDQLADGYRCALGARARAGARRAA
jgi:glycosyltransferase involved in cell wall biosynthesis